MISTILNDPVPSTSTNLRPFVNKDVTNDVVYKHGLSRPMKHYRLGVINAVTIDPTSSARKLSASKYKRDRVFDCKTLQK